MMFRAWVILLNLVLSQLCMFRPIHEESNIYYTNFCEIHELFAEMMLHDEISECICCKQLSFSFSPRGAEENPTDF